MKPRSTRSRNMEILISEKTMGSCCTLCSCLGYCFTLHHDAPQRSSLAVLGKHSFSDFESSAMKGCCFCDVLMQSFMMFQYIEHGMQVELLLYQQSPAELHSISGTDVQDIVEIYACFDTDVPSPTLGRDVPQVSTIETSMHFLRKSYSSCVADHVKCQGEVYTLPKRVVDISQNWYRLLEPSAGTTGAYAALSYSWGTKGWRMNTIRNYEELKHGFDPGQLPIAFRDAAAVARGLGIKYLWIDTLCIIQDSTLDWEEQAARMGEVFEGAAITISAASSVDPYHTLFEARDSPQREIELFSSFVHNGDDVMFKARKKITRGIHAKTGRTNEIDPLDTRAWGLQEKLLSRRLIAFTGSEMQWTCRTLKACECHQETYPVEALFLAPTGLSNTEEVTKQARSWSHVIEEYSARKLTFSEDKLPALGGLASRFGTVTGFAYIAGLWKESILYDLVWQREKGSHCECSYWLGPTFSWVSAKGAVNFRLARHSYAGPRTQHTEVLHMCYRTVGHDTYSRAVESSLTLRGHTVNAVLRRSSGTFPAYVLCVNDTTYMPNMDQRAICEFSIDAFVPSYTCRDSSDSTAKMQPEGAIEKTSQSAEGPVVLLSLYSIHSRRCLYQNFLILAKSCRDPDAYERIGVGSGKLYRKNGRRFNMSSGAPLVRPFEWLSVDLESGSRAMDEPSVLEQVICVR